MKAFVFQPTHHVIFPHPTQVTVTESRSGSDTLSIRSDKQGTKFPRRRAGTLEDRVCGLAGRESHSDILDTIPKHYVRHVTSLKDLLSAILCHLVSLSFLEALADPVSEASDGTEHTRSHKITLEARREKVLAKIAAAQVGRPQEKC